MKLFKPFFKLNRLLVFSSGGKVAFDENFHHGLNIIRGQNSSGKSTIANLIFYAMGGDFKRWTNAALECNSVFAEVEINSAPITLRRVVSSNGSQPMDIFWGSYNESIKSDNEGWQSYSYKKSDKKKSFSNALFLTLGLPELRGDVDSNITMHQILRLLYVDQKSLTLDLLMTESFDSAITRKTVSDLLLGVYDDSLYAEKLELRELEKEFEIKKSQFDGIIRILRSSDAKLDKNEINQELKVSLDAILEIDKYLEKSEELRVRTGAENEGKRLKIVSVQNRLVSSKAAFSKVKSDINDLVVELEDSSEFLCSLQKRAAALSDSLLIREAFSEMKVSQCPKCLLPLMPAKDDDHCELCKEKLSEAHENSRIKRMQQEIDNQIRESKKLYAAKHHKLLEFMASLPVLEQDVVTCQFQLNEALSEIKSTRDQELDDLLVKKGEIKGKIDNLKGHLKALEQIEVLKKELSSLKSKIESLKQSIGFKEQSQRARLSRAYATIEASALDLLSSDLGRQPEFRTGKKVDLDFEKNTFSLDGENNFSESSNVFLKNSVRFAIFLAALQFDFFRYPRFILCDNIEDKGMEPGRSQSFQRKVAELSQKSGVAHQIIITTSMIDPGLNDSKLCVGKFFTKESKTLSHLSTRT